MTSQGMGWQTTAKNSGKDRGPDRRRRRAGIVRIMRKTLPDRFMVDAF
jgi:hypothetical protein